MFAAMIAKLGTYYSINNYFFYRDQFPVPRIIAKGMHQNKN
jgi:hypothetical protein